MAIENQIILRIDVPTSKGQREVKKLFGTFEELDKKLEELARTSGTVGVGFDEIRREIRQLRRAGVKDISILTAAIQKFQQERGPRGRFGRVPVGGGIRGVRRRIGAAAETKAQNRELAEQNKLIRQAEALRLREQRAAQKAVEQRAAQRARRGQALFQTLGFTGVAIGTTLKTAFQGLNFQGLFGPVFSQIGGIFGTLFGQAIGAIFTDAFRAGGELAEALLQGLSGVLRIGLRAIGSFIETIGISVIAVAMTGPIGIAIGIIGGLLRAGIEIFSGFVTEIVNVLRSLLKAIVSILSAFARIIRGIFNSIFKIVINIWKGIWETLKSIAQLATKAIIGIINKFVEQIAKGFSGFIRVQEEAAKTFGLVTSVAGQSTRKFANLAFKVASDFGFALSDIQKTLFDVVSAGFRKSAQASQVLEAASRLAIAGNASLAGSTKAVISVLRAYGKSASEADRTTRVLFAGQVFARATVDEFASALTNIIPIASAAGVSFEDVTKTLAAITLSGFSASRASRGLSLLLTGLIAPSSQIRKKMEGIGLSFTTISKEGKFVLKPLGDIIRQLQKVSIAEIRTVASRIQSRNAVLALKSSFEEFLKIERDFEKTTRTLDKAQEGITATFGRQIKILQQNIEVIRAFVIGGIAESFQFAFKRIVDGLKTITQALLDSSAIRKFFNAFIDFAKPVLTVVLEPIDRIIRSIVGFIEENKLEEIFKTGTAQTLQRQLLLIADRLSDIPSFLRQAFQEILFVLERAKVEFDFLSATAKNLKILFSTLIDTTVLGRIIARLATLFEALFLAIGEQLFRILAGAFEASIDLFVALIGRRIAQAFKNIVSEFQAGFLETIAGPIGTAIAALSPAFRAILPSIRTLVAAGGPELLRQPGRIAETKQFLTTEAFKKAGGTFEDNVRTIGGGLKRNLQESIAEKRREIQARKDRGREFKDLSKEIVTMEFAIRALEAAAKQILGGEQAVEITKALNKFKLVAIDAGQRFNSVIGPAIKKFALEGGRTFAQEAGLKDFRRREAEALEQRRTKIEELKIKETETREKFERTRTEDAVRRQQEREIETQKAFQAESFRLQFAQASLIPVGRLAKTQPSFIAATPTEEQQKRLEENKRIIEVLEEGNRLSREIRENTAGRFAPEIDLEEVRARLEASGIM